MNWYFIVTNMMRILVVSDGDLRNSSDKYSEGRPIVKVLFIADSELVGYSGGYGKV